MMFSRFVALVDMDCFYCQVEARLNPSLKGKPMAVVQYNQWKGGGIIAVNYEARDRGVTRHMRGDEAKKHCPDIQLVSVPAVRGKADLTKYRDAGREVIKVICEFSECVQRASVDEAYIDLTDAVEKRIANKVKVTPTQLENTFVVGYSSIDNNDEDQRETGVATWLDDVYNSNLSDPDLHRLATATAIVEEMRAAVFENTGFRCSAGISHNKILAKLVCGLHKPNRQTVLPMSSLAELYRTLPVKKVRNLGGKFGADVVEKLGITHMAELVNFTEKQLQAKYDEKTGTWLYNIARGIDLDPVTPRLISKSIGCCKKFPGRTALSSKLKVTHWLSELATEVSERLDEDIHMNNRKAQLLTIHFSQEIEHKDISMSRSVPLPGYEAEKIAACAFNVLSRHSTQTDTVWRPPLKYLGLSAGKFVEYSGNKNGSIDKFFKTKSSVETNGENTNNSHEINLQESVEQVSRDVQKSENDYETKTNEEENQTIMKVNTMEKVSFFERYFKNKQNKIVKNSPTKEITDQVNNIHENLKVSKDNSACNEISLNMVTNQDVSKTVVSDNDDEISNKQILCNSQYVQAETVDMEDESWISPSEIFPDLEDIDDSVINILPTPLQRKISKIKESKNMSLLSKGNKTFDNYPNSHSRVSTDSDCTPTILETVVDIHNAVREQNIAGTSSKCLVQNREVVTEDKDAIDLEELYNKTSNEKEDENAIDLEDLSDKTSSEHVFNHRLLKDEAQSEICDKCKKYISVYELQEHLDYHVAIELHENLNGQVQPNRTMVSNQIKTNSLTVASDKKKRGRSSKKEAFVPKKARTIMSFFSKS